MPLCDHPQLQAALKASDFILHRFFQELRITSNRGFSEQADESSAKAPANVEICVISISWSIPDTGLIRGLGIILLKYSPTNVGISKSHVSREKLGSDLARGPVYHPVIRSSCAVLKKRIGAIELV